MQRRKNEYCGHVDPERRKNKRYKHGRRHCPSFGCKPRSQRYCPHGKNILLPLKTRRFPWGIQRLVSTHQFPQNPRGRSIQSAKICPNLHWGGGAVVQTNSTQIAKICPNLHFQGGGGSRREILELGALKEF